MSTNSAAAFGLPGVSRSASFSSFAAANPLNAKPMPSLLERVKASQWRPPPPQQGGPPLQVLDAAFPFQVSCCEICGSLCSPLITMYRDQSTIMYRVQQHCRKLVPRIINDQSSALQLSRSAQRGVLDVSDSLSIIDTLNTHVSQSFVDIKKRTQHCVEMLEQASRERREEEQSKRERVAAQMNAATVLPLTPSHDRSLSASMLEAHLGGAERHIVGHRGVNGPQQDVPMMGAEPIPADYVFHAHNVSLASAMPSASPSVAATPSKLHAHHSRSSSIAAGRANSVGGGGATMPPPPLSSPSRSGSMSSLQPSSGTLTPRSSALRAKLSSVFSSTSSSSTAAAASAASTNAGSTLAAGGSSTLPLGSAPSSVENLHDFLHPSVTLANPHEVDHEHAVTVPAHIEHKHEHAFVP